MERTRLSTKGQIVLPQAIRTSRAWGPGTEFIVEESAEGVFLRPALIPPESTLDEVAGCLRSKGKPKTLTQMDAAIRTEVTSRHGRGRY